MKLSDAVAIVTGASRGLGYAAAVALAEEGVRVLATARSQNDLEALSDRHPDRIVPHVCDMRDLDAVADLPTHALEAFGRLDVIVNNAGIAPAGAFIDATVQGLNDVFAVNVVAPAVLTRAAGKQMISQKRGKIINIASISGIRGKAMLVGYSASKGALVQFTKALAAEWARYNIQVNSIAPGGFATEAQAAVLNDPDVLMKRTRKIPAGRMARPSEIGGLVCYLASPLSDFVTGGIYAIDGGETAKI